MTDISAAIGREQLKKLPGFNARRREIAEMYNSELSELVMIPKNRRGHVFHQYTIRCDRRDDLRNFLLERKINTGIYYPTLLYNYPSMSSYQSSCQNAESLIKEVLSLPVHPALSDSDVFEVISSIKAFFKE